MDRGDLTAQSDNEDMGSYGQRCTKMTISPSRCTQFRVSQDSFQS